MAEPTVFSRLIDDVLSGRYEPGEKLPTQRALAAELKVNMGPVREAVKRLEQLGLVDVRHGDAMRVADWRTSGGLDVIAHVLFAAGGLDREILGHLMEARRLMLTEAARLAAQRRTPEQAQRLTDTARRLADPADAESSSDARQLLDYAFFADIVEAAGNVVLVLILNSIRRIYFERAHLFEDMLTDDPSPYVEAAAAIERGDGDAAAAAVAELAGEQERRLMEATG